MFRAHRRMDLPVRPRPADPAGRAAGIAHELLVPPKERGRAPPVVRRQPVLLLEGPLLEVFNDVSHDRLLMV